MSDRPSLRCADPDCGADLRYELWVEETILSRRLVEWDGDAPRFGASEPDWESAETTSYACGVCGGWLTPEQAVWLFDALGDHGDPMDLIR